MPIASGPAAASPPRPSGEYAARAGTASARYGDLNAIGWSADNSGKPLDSAHAWNVTSGKDWGKYAKLLKANGNQIKPVGLKRGNPWGLDDVLGNVWEWCFDWHVGDYYTPSPATDPKGPNSGTDRVVRGGSWLYSPGNLRLSCRGRYVPGVRYLLLGFRCVGEVFPLTL